MAFNLEKTYERLMYSEDREELVMALNFTKSIYDRARKCSIGTVLIFFFLSILMSPMLIASDLEILEITQWLI